MARVTVTQCRKGILFQRIRSTSQTCVEARYQCGMVFECSFRGKPVVAIAKCPLFSQATHFTDNSLLWHNFGQKGWRNGGGGRGGVSGRPNLPMLWIVKLRNKQIFMPTRWPENGPLNCFFFDARESFRSEEGILSFFVYIPTQS